MLAISTTSDSNFITPRTTVPSAPTTSKTTVLLTTRIKNLQLLLSYHRRVGSILLRMLTIKNAKAVHRLAPNQPNYARLLNLVNDVLPELEREVNKNARTLEYQPNLRNSKPQQQKIDCIEQKSMHLQREMEVLTVRLLEEIAGGYRAGIF